MITNNITRLLVSRKIPFTVFELPAEKVGAEETARRLGVPAMIVYKTIVVVREKPGKPVLAVIPGPYEVDLKAVAVMLGEKKVHLPTQREAEELTGLEAGGISPLALLNKGFQTLIDVTVKPLIEMHISGGQRGLNIRLPVAALIQLTNARIGPVGRSALEED